MFSICWWVCGQKGSRRGLFPGLDTAEVITEKLLQRRCEAERGWCACSVRTVRTYTSLKPVSNLLIAGVPEGGQTVRGDVDEIFLLYLYNCLVGGTGYPYVVFIPRKVYLGNPIFVVIW